jgi:two-component system, chemotaxis family, chemotaxis protein CheY
MTLKLLAVDDDATSAELVVRIAERCGFEAFATSDPRGFLELCKQLNPSVVTIDINMPNIDANGVLKLLADVFFRGKTIIVSGQDTDVMRRVSDFGESLGLQRPEFIQKPIDLGRMRIMLGGFWKEIQTAGERAG